MNNLQFSEISDNYYYNFDNNNLYNNNNYNYNNNYNNPNNYNYENLEYNSKLIDNILLCEESKIYIKNKILNEDILLKSIYKILIFEKETIIIMSLGMLLIILILLIINLFKTISR
tara:strand:+ start:2661 stop:3008 length:348 start_codon:yes stop_codon:yes gene_type:complete